MSKAPKIPGPNSEAGKRPKGKAEGKAQRTQEEGMEGRPLDIAERFLIISSLPLTLVLQLAIRFPCWLFFAVCWPDNKPWNVL